MKFLVVRKPRINAALVASSKAIREHKEGAANAIKQKTIDCIYGLLGGGGSVAVVNADSAEQLQENLANTPLFLFSEFEIRPLTDYAKYMDSVATALEKQGR